MSDHELTAEEHELAAEETVQAVYAFAAEQMEQGVRPEDIEAELMQKGLDREAAAIVVNNLTTARHDAARSAGNKNMMYGAMWCVGGLAVTAISYGAASEGGSYVFAWGAVLFGGIQFVRGLFQSVA